MGIHRRQFSAAINQRQVHSLKLRSLILLSAAVAALALIVWLSLAAPPRETQVIRVAADPQLDAGRAVGFGPGKASAAAGYMRQVARASGLAFVYVPTRSRADSFDRLLAGQVDLVPTLLDVPQPLDASKIALSAPYYKGRTIIATRRNEKFLNLDDLARRRVAIRGGGEYDQWLRLHRPEIELLTFADVPSVLDAVEAGVADAALGTDVVYRPLLRRDYSHSLVEAGFVAELPVAVRSIVRRQDHALIARLDQGLAMLTAAQHVQVLDQWLDLAYRPPPNFKLLLRHYWLELSLVAITLLALIFAIGQLRKSRRLARLGEHEKARILAVVSHEIRNSAGALQSAVELLAGGTVLAEQRPLLDAAVASCSSLGLLLDNALEYSRLEAGQFSSSPIACDVVSLVEECLCAFGPQAKLKNLELISSYPQGRPSEVLVDSVLLQQVVSNLVSNALKFTNKGSIVVSVLVEDSGGQAPILHLAVEDTGVGMEDRVVESLFTPYSQAGGARALGGAGLGLSICRDIVTRLGGRIEVKSRINQGSAFQVHLPVRWSLEQRIEERQDAPPALLSGNYGERHILLVEDHAYGAKMLSLQLQSFGCLVTHAIDGQSAQAAFQENGPFDSVLLDCNLPDIDGYELATWIRQAERRLGWKRAELFATSALRGTEHERACWDAGFDHVLTKPLSRLQLQRHLGTHAGMELATSLLDMFWQLYWSDMAALEGAVTTSDWKKASEMAHRICGSAGFAGESEIHALSHALMIGLHEIDGSEDLPDPLREKLVVLKRCGSARQPPGPSTGSEPKAPS